MPRLYCSAAIPTAAQAQLMHQGQGLPLPTLLPVSWDFCRDCPGKGMRLVKGRWPCCCSIVIYCVTVVVIGVCEQGSQIEG